MGGKPMSRSARIVLLVLISFLFLPRTAPLAAQILRGEEVVVHQAAGPVEATAVATAQNGDFVVVWQSSSSPSPEAPAEVYFRLFRADGRPRTGAVHVARSKKGATWTPRVAMAADGRFLVLWHAQPRPTSRVQIFARRFAADGRPLRASFAVTPPPAFDQYQADVAMGPAGRFVVTWSESDGDVSPEDGGPTFNLLARRFKADGQPLGAAFTIEDAVTQASGSRVAINAAGDFVVAWQSWEESTVFDIFAQRFRANGSAFSERLKVNHGELEFVTLQQVDPAVALADDGRFLVAWTDLAGDFQALPSASFEDLIAVMAQHFGSDGAPRGENFRVNVFSHGSQENPTVARTGDGGFLVSWTSGAGQDGDGRGIFARSIAPDGRRRGREFRINLGRDGEQFRPSLALASSGRGAVVWTSSTGPSGDARLGISGRRFVP
jgi:hypothetical protein